MMKILYLFWHRIRRYAQKDKTIFVLFIIGGMINAIIFAYFYGNVLPITVNRNATDNYYRKYMVFFDTDYPVNAYAAEINSLFENDLIESVVLRYFLKDSQGKAYILCGSYQNTVPVVAMTGTNILSEPGQIVVGCDNTSPIGSAVTIGSKTYTIVGRHTWDEHYISATDFCQDFGTINALYVYSAERHSYHSDPVVDLLNTTFPNMDIRSPDVYEIRDEDQSLAELITISMVYIASTISFIFLFRHLIDSMMDENTTSLIVGAPKGKMISMIFWEQLLLFLFANISGLLVHYALTPVLFSKINIVEDFVYTYGDYAAILLIMFCLNTLTLVPTLGKYKKLSPIASRRIYT